MADDHEGPRPDASHADAPSEGGKRRRRRRNRKKRAEPDAQAPNVVEVAERGRLGRRQMVEFDGPTVSTPSSGRNPQKKRNSRARRGKPGSASLRKRKVSKVALESVTDWLDGMPAGLLTTLYRGLGGQPKRAGTDERVLHLVVKAVMQSGRLGGVARQLHERDRKALAALLQCGGLAHADEFHHELVLTYGGHERDWRRCMLALGDRGLVVATGEQDGHFFYIVPDPLLDGLAEALEPELSLPVFEHDDMRIIEQRPWTPPLDFSITTLATYIGQHAVRLTQRHDVFRVDQETMDAFFSQLWDADSELFKFHLDFLMMHGIVVLRGDTITLDREVMEEFLQLEPEDQRDLVFRALDRRFDMAEWVLWALAEAGEGWIAERPLSAMYRHWQRGKAWRERLRRGVYANARTAERDSFTFSTLVQCGLMELGQWGQEKFYRLSSRARTLLEPDADDGFRQFYLTPDFKIMAPSGLAPVLLFRIGELADLKSCDRANTYQITEERIEASIEAGWRRDDVLGFLRDYSQIGLPDNVEQTLKGWIGHRGDVEFHDLMLLTVHRSQIRRLETNRRFKPYLLHRFAPGLYAVDRTRKDELARLLADAGFAPSKEVRGYPGDPAAVEARHNLHRMLAEAREAVGEPMTRETGLVDPARLRAVPGTRGVSKAAEPDLPPMVTPPKARQLIDLAMHEDKLLEMVYLAGDGRRIPCVVQPQRLAFKAETPVLAGLDVGADERRTYALDRIERLRIKEDA